MICDCMKCRLTTTTDHGGYSQVIMDCRGVFKDKQGQGYLVFQCPKCHNIQLIEGEKILKHNDDLYGYLTDYQL